MSLPELLDDNPKKEKKIFGIKPFMFGALKFEPILLERTVMYLVLNPNFDYEYIDKFIYSMCRLSREDVLAFLEEQNSFFKAYSFVSINAAKIIKKIEMWESDIIGERLSNKDLKKLKAEMSPLIDEYINERICGQLLKPSQIVENLSRYVIGQDEFVKDLSLEIYKYQLSLRDKADKQYSTKENKNVILLWGHSGSGKTYIVHQIAELFNANLISIGLNNITSSAYYGNTLNAQIYNQYKNTKKSKSPFSILFLDETDKLVSKLEVKKAVIDEILLLLSNKTMSYEYKWDVFDMDFSSYIIIMAGNFMKLNKEHRKIKQVIGFGNQNENNDKEIEEITDAQFLIDMLGVEFVTRCSKILRVESLNKKDVLKKILLHSEKSPLLYIKSFMEKHSKQFVYTEREIDEIVSRAMKSNTGARGLFNVTLEYYKNLLYEVANNNDIKNHSQSLDELPF